MGTGTCEWCGKHFSRPTAWLKRSRRHFCSAECRSASDVRNVDVTCLACSKHFIVRPSEAKKYSTCSEECRSVRRSQEFNSNWKGGVAGRRAEMSTSRYKRWRKAVMAEGSYACQFCGTTDGELHADHIRPWAFFPEDRYEVSNGRVLCAECHKKTYKRLKRERMGHVAVDLDCTLAYYDGWKGPTHIGEPIPLMAQRVREWVASGREVVIFTARAATSYEERDVAIKAIQDWTELHFGVRLRVTAEKDFDTVQIWDDRARQVKENTGVLVK